MECAPFCVIRNKGEINKFLKNSIIIIDIYKDLCYNVNTINEFLTKRIQFIVA